VQENLIDLNVSLGWAYLGLGEWEPLEEVLDYLHALIAKEGDQPSDGHGRALRLFARVAVQRAGQGPTCEAASFEAFQYLEKSAAIFAQIGNQLDRCRALADQASLLVKQGQQAQAALLVDEARAVFKMLGARIELERLQEIVE
jgi:hypothetical protein